MNQLSYQDKMLRENNRELDDLRHEEQKPEILGARVVNRDIDPDFIASMEQDMNDFEEEQKNKEIKIQENQLLDDEIKDVENTLEIMDILNLIDSMTDEERYEFFNSKPECLTQNTYFNSFNDDSLRDCLFSSYCFK
ncbi:hypothetical protein M9Y10_035184 [Tritrichomonas musculus]|uniref:Uncharacterized protein n=1 Tax=Tritrichomonas musculus TaxID=1915356 RepID=A0ABR2KGY6_9EUKA